MQRGERDQRIALLQNRADGQLREFQDDRILRRLETHQILVPGRLGHLLASSVQRIARRHQLLADLSRPLLDKGVAIGDCGGELVLGFGKAVAVEILRPQNFHTLIRSGQQIEAAAGLIGGQTGPHTLDLL